MTQHTTPKVISALHHWLCNDNLLTAEKGVLRGVFVANHLSSTDNLPITTERQQNTYKRKLMHHKKCR